MQIDLHFKLHKVDSNITKPLQIFIVLMTKPNSNSRMDHQLIFTNLKIIIMEFLFLCSPSYAIL